MTKTQTLYINDFMSFRHIKLFLLMSKCHWDMKDNTEKKKEAEMYINTIVRQKPTKEQQFELEIPRTAYEFARITYHDFDEEIWKTIDNSDMIKRIDVDCGHESLMCISSK